MIVIIKTLNLKVYNLKSDFLCTLLTLFSQNLSLYTKSSVEKLESVLLFLTFENHFHSLFRKKRKKKKKRGRKI